MAKYQWKQDWKNNQKIILGPQKTREQLEQFAREHNYPPIINIINGDTTEEVDIIGDDVDIVG